MKWITGKAFAASLSSTLFLPNTIELSEECKRRDMDEHRCVTGITIWNRKGGQARSQGGASSPDTSNL
jgi:hypothetical protein